MIVRSRPEVLPVVRVRAPLRLGLGGGGTDLSPYCDRFGGAVLNVTIDQFAHATVAGRSDGAVRFVSADAVWEAPAHAALETDSPLSLHAAVYRRMVREFNGGRPLPITLATSSGAPPGSGLGASSALVVAMVKAWAAWRNVPLDRHQIARLAFSIERRDAAQPGGRQDQYASVFGGLNFIEFHAGEHVVVTPVAIAPQMLAWLERSLLLFYTGVSRDSAAIIAEQQRRLSSDSDLEALEAMHELKACAHRLRTSLETGDVRGVHEAINGAWSAKRRTASGISNPHLDAICGAAMRAGAIAGKVSGAGGGGFIVFFVPPADRSAVVQTLARFTGHVADCHLLSSGAQVC